LKLYTKNNYEIAKWYIKALLYPLILKELLLDCPSLDMEYFVLGLMKNSLITLYNKDKYMDYDSFINES